MDKQTAHNIMGFMMRVQLTGQEVPAFNAAMGALQAAAEEPTEKTTPGAEGEQ